MKLSLKFIVLTSIGVVGFSIWTAVAFTHPEYMAEYMKFVQVSTLGAVGLALRETKTGDDK